MPTEKGRDVEDTPSVHSRVLGVASRVFDFLRCETPAWMQRTNGPSAKGRREMMTPTVAAPEPQAQGLDSLPDDLNKAAQLGAQEAGKLLSDAWGDEWRGPIDPAEIARKKGIRVVRFPFQDGDHRSGWLNQETFDEIVINSRDSLDTQRNSLSHELGHWYSGRIMHRPLGSCNRNKSRSETTPDDAYADSFALSLLMPEGITRAAVMVGYTALGIAITCAVSRESAENRLHDLGIA